MAAEPALGLGSGHGTAAVLPAAATAVAADFGKCIVGSAFVLAFFGWGVGFYGPSLYLGAVVQQTGWALQAVSLAVTLHFLSGVVVIWNLPRLLACWGVPATIARGSLVTAVGLCGWSVAQAPWQLYLAATISGVGWVTLGAVTVNAIISPWFDTGRAKALAIAYNGGTVGGVLFPPLWVALAAGLGFTGAALAVGCTMLATMVLLGRHVFSRQPGACAGNRALAPDAATPPVAAPPGAPAVRLWHSRAFQLLALGAATGLFAQMGVFSHLFLLLTATLGSPVAGLVVGGAAALAILGRTVAARCIARGIEPRTVAGTSYAIQALGTLLLLLAGPGDAGWILAGVALAGTGLGTTSYLPPLIAHRDFAPGDVPRVVSRVIALGQGSYAFAPLFFGTVLAGTNATGQAGIGPRTVVFFALAACMQLIAATCFFAHPSRSTRIGSH